MSNTTIHKLEGKFKNKIHPAGRGVLDIEYKDLAELYPLKFNHKCNRKNFASGYYKNLRNKIKEKIFKNNC